MKVYRSAMEKKMDQLENEQIITNPGQRFKTFLRKLAYRWEMLRFKVRRFFGRERDH